LPLSVGKALKTSCAKSCAMPCSCSFARFIIEIFFKNLKGNVDPEFLPYSFLI
jgi:hypothetical protein